MWSIILFREIHYSNPFKVLRLFYCSNYSQDYAGSVSRLCRKFTRKFIKIFRKNFEMYIRSVWISKYHQNYELTHLNILENQFYRKVNSVTLKFLWLTLKFILVHAENTYACDRSKILFLIRISNVFDVLLWLTVKT